MKEITFDEFIEQFKPVENRLVEDAAFDGYMFETYDEEWEHIQTIESKYIWTIVEAEGEFYLSNGVRFVNRMGYIITKIPWKEEYNILID